MMRLDRFLANSGAGTRNEVKKMIREGLVEVNGTRAKKGSEQVDENNDVITLEGSVIRYSRYVYFMLNKPQGCISATEGNMPTVMDLIAEPYNDMFPCGRLDKDTEGLLLITNDGPLAHALLSPSRHVEKEYFVKLRDPIGEDYAEKLAAGMKVDGDLQCQPAVMKPIDAYTCTVILKEGKFHEIKRLFAALGNEVVFLKRLRMKNLVLDEDLAPGEYRPLYEEEIEDLRESQE